MSTSTKLLVILSIALIILATITEAKRRPGRRRRPRYRDSYLPVRQPQESKNVFYYQLPQSTARPPRIILGDELNFSELGIKSKNQKHRQLTSPSNPISDQSPYAPYDLETDFVQNHPPLPYNPAFSSRKQRPPPKNKRRGRGRPSKNKRPRGPGYRLERPWQDGVVIEQSYKQKPRPLGQYYNSLQVMPYLKSAGRNLVGAYRAAVLNSAKMAHFTGHAASKYFKGVRNLMGRNNDPGRSDIKVGESEVEQVVAPSDEEAIVLKEELPPTSGKTSDEVVEVDLTNVEDDESNGVLPKVYLDWGGSFWRFFYNKSNDMAPPEGKGKSIAGGRVLVVNDKKN